MLINILINLDEENNWILFKTNLPQFNEYQVFAESFLGKYSKQKNINNFWNRYLINKINLE